MAFSVATLKKDKCFEGTDHSVICGICKSDVQTPKFLKCLHNFCLKCLPGNVNAVDNTVACPTCDEITQLQRDGVDGLNTNYMLIEKQERKSLKEQLKGKDTMIPCTCCEISKNKAVAWCKECEDYMCVMTLEYHQIQRKLKLHEVISLDKLQSELVQSVGGQKERMCTKHEDEKLRFYCETCEIPLCRDCEIIDHPISDNHAQVYLKDAVKKRSDEIQKEAKECERVAYEVEKTLTQDEIIKVALMRGVKETLDEYDNASKLAKLKFLDGQRKHRERFLSDLTQFEEKRKREIDGHEQKLKNIRSRISSVLAVADMLAVSGTQYDVADLYKDVITALRKLHDFKPVAEHFSNVNFKFNDECLPFVESVPAPGSLKVGIWELKHVFGKNGDGKLSGARGVALTSADDIVVANYNARNIKVFNGQGDYIKTLNADFTYPFDITITRDDCCYVTDTSPTTKIFNSQMIHDTNFQSGISSKLCGIAATKTGGLAICSFNQNLIYIYNDEGDLICTIPVLQPWYIAVTSEDNFVFTSGNQKSVQVVTAYGQLMQIIGPPPNFDGNSWAPYGVCCSPDNEIIVANRGTKAMGIYRFKISGEFIDCITTEVNKPWGLAMSEDGEKLAVVDENGTSVKIFSLK